MRALLIAAAIATAASFLSFTSTVTAVTSAGETMCTTTLGPVTVRGNLVVPAGAFCRLNGTHVTGNVTVESGSHLGTPAGPTIDGNVDIEPGGDAVLRLATVVRGNYRCNQCNFADLHDSTVRGNYQDNGLTEGVFLDGSTIGGNLEIRNSLGGGFGFDVHGNSVGGNFLFEGNSGDPSSDISTNTIKGNLECQGNTPPPTGAGNSAKQKLGQCAAL
jgi:hypothetical protein